MVVETEQASARLAGARESVTAAEARHAADIYVRTSWVDAALALSELEKVTVITMLLLALHVSLFFCECQWTAVARMVAPAAGRRRYYQGRFRRTLQ